MVMSRGTALTWLVLLLLPPLILLAAQVPLCSVKSLSDFFESLPQLKGIWLLTAVIALPGYVVILWQFASWKKRLLQAALLTLIYIPYLPLVWIFGFWTSRLLFTGCMQ